MKVYRRVILTYIKSKFQKYVDTKDSIKEHKNKIHKNWILFIQFLTFVICGLLFLFNIDEIKEHSFFELVFSLFFLFLLIFSVHIKYYINSIYILFFSKYKISKEIHHKENELYQMEQYFFKDENLTKLESFYKNFTDNEKNIYNSLLSKKQ